MGSGGAMAAIGGLGSLFGGLLGSSAAKDAAEIQAAAARYAADMQMKMFHEQEKNLEPFRLAGVDALGQLMDRLPGFTRAFQPTMAELEATPGYQFALKQGLQATQNSYAAQGLGQSGAALKGAANYAQGLASTTYQQQLQNYMAQNQQAYNMLGGIVQTGLGAGTSTAQLGMQAQTQANQLMTSGAAAQAAGIVGSANAWGGALNGLTSSLSNGMMFNMMANKGMFG